MAKCGYCGSTIVFGGVRSGAEQFCNNQCHSNAHILGFARQIPAEVIGKQVEEVFRGVCPQCRGLGPIEVHKVHSVWSAIAVTRWSTKLRVCCRSCAMKGQLGGALFSLALGWWGFPWGLVLTPVQIARNIKGIYAGPDASGPSEELRKWVMVSMAAQAMQKQQEQGAAPPIR